MNRANLPRRSGDAAKADHSEVSRQLVHVSMGGFALLLRWLSWWQALGLAATALVFNLFILPRFAHTLYRPGDRDRPIQGIVLYPVAVLVLIAMFPSRPDIAAAAWGILAVGDGIATLGGRAIGGPRWPWSPDKTVAGTLAFVIGGSIAGCGLAWWCRPAGDPAAPVLFALLAPPVAAVAAGFVETIPVRLDDNLTVAASAGATLWLVALVCARYAAALDSYLPLQSQGAGYQSFFTVSVPTIPVAAALITNAAAGAAGYAAKSVGLSGAIGGAIIGIAIFLSLGWQGWTLLFVTFIAATIATRTGRARKQQLGIAEERGGRRGAGNAIANTGVAAIAATLAGLDVHSGAAQLAFVTALVAGGSDTIASEIGKAYGRRTYSITALSRIAPGTSGAMSIEGTAAGVLGAIGLSGVAIVLGLLALPSLPLVVICATIGALVESWLGGTLEGPGILNNDMLNFINTAIAAAVAVIIAAARS
jgi:uncharacterized protein (TIGR00297 family)